MAFVLKVGGSIVSELYSIKKDLYYYIESMSKKNIVTFLLIVLYYHLYLKWYMRVQFFFHTDPTIHTIKSYSYFFPESDLALEQLYNYCLIHYLLLDNSICHETHKLYHFLSIMIRVHSFLDIFFWLGYKRGDWERKHLTYSLITTKCGGSLNTPSAKKVSLIFTMWPN